jgi:pimeloyl-ACP methyl ester carboxylesterase
MIAKRLKAGLAAAVGVGTLGLAAAPTQPLGVKNIVLVHGAWVDGSGWKPVYEILVRDGYAVTQVQEPLTSFADDVAAARRVVAQQNGPCILVAHSYGGSVISQAGTDPHVVGLVYIAAHMPDAGESEAADGARYPSALSMANVKRTTSDGYTYLDPAQFPKYFAADLPQRQAEFAAHSQTWTAAAVFQGKVTTPAWKSKPSWMLVAGADLIINPELELWYAKRAHSHIVEVRGASHSVYASHPKEVAAMIEDAARQVIQMSDLKPSSSPKSPAEP